VAPDQGRQAATDIATWSDVATRPYELTEGNAAFTFALYPVYLRGEAYLGAKQGTAAATEFQKILGHSGVVGNEPIGVLAHLGPRLPTITSVT